MIFDSNYGSNRSTLRNYSGSLRSSDSIRKCRTSRYSRYDEAVFGKNRISVPIAVGLKLSISQIWHWVNSSESFPLLGMYNHLNTVRYTNWELPYSPPACWRCLRSQSQVRAQRFWKPISCKFLIC